MSAPIIPIVAVMCPTDPCCASVSWYEIGMSTQPNPRLISHVTSCHVNPLLLALRSFRVSHIASVPTRGVPTVAYAAPGQPPGYLAWPCGSPVQWAPLPLPCPCPRHRPSGMLRLPVNIPRAMEQGPQAEAEVEFEFPAMTLRAAQWIEDRVGGWAWEVERAPADFLPPGVVIPHHTT